MTGWYRDSQTQLVHRGLLHLGMVSGACSEQFAPVDPEITLPPGESPREHGCPACVAGRPPDGDYPAQMAALVGAAPRRWMDKLGWEGLAVLVTLAALVALVIVAWPR